MVVKRYHNWVLQTLCVMDVKELITGPQILLPMVKPHIKNLHFIVILYTSHETGGRFEIVEGGGYNSLPSDISEIQNERYVVSRTVFYDLQMKTSLFSSF